VVTYERKILKNGLTVIVHQDTSSPLVAINVLYKVGSRDEDPNKTGFTHLFEHLMFGGSRNVPDFDHIIQQAGGENNAFTNNDITNFYDVFPAENLDIGMWIESDRMNGLKLSPRVLNTQKKVVIEEFKETCLNEPYGDLWHHLGEMAYKKHSYRWPTIGKDMSHIESASMADVKHFYNNYYRPNNAILVLAGNISPEEGFAKAQHWFGRLRPAETRRPLVEFEDEDFYSEEKVVHANVPLKSLILAFRMPGRIEADFYVADLLSDALASGRSCRFYRRLVKDRQIFSNIDAFVSGSDDPGLFIIDGKLMDNISPEEAEAEVWKEIEELRNVLMPEKELQKLKNRAESSIVFSEISILNKAMSLAYYEHLGDIELINSEVDFYHRISTEDMQRVAKSILDPNKVFKLWYLPAN
jgi:zinc protease